MKLNSPIVARVLALATLLQGTGLPQSYTLCTISNGTATGIFGGVNVSGTYTLGLTPNTSNITVAGTSNSAYTYSYTFTGPVDGAGYTQTSKIPPVPCIVAGCPPGGTEPPGAATLSVAEVSPTLASLGFEDTGEIFTGYGTLSCQTAGNSSPPPPPEA